MYQYSSKPKSGVPAILALFLASPISVLIFPTTINPSAKLLFSQLCFSMHSTSVTITNPLVLYRSLIATQKIRPDPAQHRLAIHLQNLYERLIDYEPSIKYSQRLKQLSQTIEAKQNDFTPANAFTNRFGRRGVWTSLLAQKERRDSLELTRVLTNHEEAMQLESPKGLMLHGEVGTGKSMLIDLFQECLPNRKKRRWHFNTFMLDTISRLEQLRKTGSQNASPVEGQDGHPLLLVARELIETSPILFLDEFQLPDRAASKILSNLMTSFFQLGGVLIATSNRMPEELAKAAGMDFTTPSHPSSRPGWSWTKSKIVRRDDGAGQVGEFSAFLDVLKARCQVYQMESLKDYRKLEREKRMNTVQKSYLEHSPITGSTKDEVSNSGQSNTIEQIRPPSEILLPTHYFIQPTTSEAMVHFVAAFNTSVEKATQHEFPVPWAPSSLTVYGRSLLIPAQYNGVAFYTFVELCGAVLGPADYITLASTYHTFLLTDVPVMRFQQKDEARRFITLLDAMYEARCRLLLTASAGPEDLLFPERSATASGLSTAAGEGLLSDAVHAETYSEIYQDLNSPFRPNISSYNTDSLPADALEDDPPNRMRRTGSSFTDERRLHPGTPNFANIGGMTGEDERFAVKRAESRIWEMCSAHWWERASSSPSNTSGGATSETTIEWWRPLPLSLRHWERRSIDTVSSKPSPGALPPNVKVLSQGEQEQDGQKELDNIFPHEASPFRVHPDAPPKISWTHAWGMMTWGKRAGAWGKGVEGLSEREKEKEKDGKGEKG